MSATTQPQASPDVEEPRPPTGVQLTPLDTVFRQDPYPVLERLRNVERIHRDEALSRWFITGFEEVREILRNKDLSSNIHNANPDSYASRREQLAGANHDPRANPDPDSFNIRRRDVRHQSFGGGKHLCLGAWLARVETQEAILGLLRRFPKLSLVEQTFEYRPVPSFRGLQQLWVSRA